MRAGIPASNLITPLAGSTSSKPASDPVTSGGKADYRYRMFGGFRLFLAFLVILQHFAADAAPLGPLYDHVVPYELGSLAVLVFFCLSGFVIAEAATQIYFGKPAAYLANRFLRIVPHFAVAVIIAVLIHAVAYHFGTLRISDRESPGLPTPHAFDVLNIIGNFFAFLPGLNRFLWFDFVDVIWAVRIEMVFYFAVFFVLLLPARRRLPFAAPYALVAFGLATAFVARQFGFGFFFLYGVMLYDHRRYPVSLVLCIIGMALHFFLLPLHAGASYERAVLPQFIILAALIAVMTWLALKPTGRHAFDQSCGELSYPLYIHFQNMLVLTLSVTTGYSYPAFAMGMAFSLVVSYGLMRLIDPVVNRFRDAVRGGRLEHTKSQG